MEMKGNGKEMKGNERKRKALNSNLCQWSVGGALRSPFLAVFGYRFVIVPVVVLDKVFDWEICLKISEAYLLQTMVPLI